MSYEGPESQNVDPRRFQSLESSVLKQMFVKERLFEAHWTCESHGDKMTYGAWSNCDEFYVDWNASKHQGH